MYLNFWDFFFRLCLVQLRQMLFVEVILPFLSIIFIELSLFMFFKAPDNILHTAHWVHSL